MYWKKNIIEKDIDNLIATYKHSTDIECIAYSISGEYLSCEIFFQRSDFCKLIQKYDFQNKCQRYYIDNALKTEKYRELSVSCCPYGLINWTVMIILSGEIKLYVTAGPVLIHKVDELTIRNIFRKRFFSISKRNQLISKLKEIKVLNLTQVKNLSKLLFRLAESCTIENTLLLDKRNKLNIINTELAQIIGIPETGVNAQDIIGKMVKIYPFEKEKQLISCVKIGDRKKAREILNEILKRIYLQEDIEIVKLNAISLIVISARTAIEAGADLKAIFEIEFAKITNILEIKEISKLHNVLETCIDKFIEYVFSTVSIGNNDIIFKAIKYIRENYKDFEINDITGEFNISAQYFSKLFKEETGISYVEYVNRVKIEASKPLLKATETLSEVAELVGFNDPSYFSKVFKQHENITPSKWKKLN